MTSECKRAQSTVDVAKQSVVARFVGVGRFLEPVATLDMCGLSRRQFAVDRKQPLPLYSRALVRCKRSVRLSHHVIHLSLGGCAWKNKRSQDSCCGKKKAVSSIQITAVHVNGVRREIGTGVWRQQLLCIYVHEGSGRPRK